MEIIKEETKRYTLDKDRLQDLFRAARTVDENKIKMQIDDDDDDESCRCEAQIKEMRWIFILYIDYIYIYVLGYLNNFFVVLCSFALVNWQTLSVTSHNSKSKR